MAGAFPWEPEEAVGTLWHRFASRLDAPPRYAEAAVELDEVAARLGVFYRGLGGDHAVELRAAADEVSHHRLSWKRRLGTVAEQAARASFDGGALRLPYRIDCLPDRAANGALYLWLAAMAAHAGQASDHADPLHADLAALQAAQQMTDATLAAAPGLAVLHAELAQTCLAQRRRGALPPLELALERAVRNLLGDPSMTVRR